MQQTLIFQPMIALVFLTFAVLLFIPLYRVNALLQKHVEKDDFKYGESANVPDSVCLPNRNYMNLLELPVLFYAVCLSLYVTDAVDAMALNLAWAYVALRVVHSAIHLSYNDVYHRVTVFAASNLVLLLIWIRFFLAL